MKFGAAASVAATSLAACSDAGNQGNAELRVICSTDYQPIIESYAAQFKRKTGTSVSVTAQAYNQTHDKIVSALSSGKAAYDITAVDSVWTAEFAQAGFLSPLDEYIQDQTWARIVPAAKLQRSWNNHIYQWPLFTMKYLYYNQKMLDKAGIDSPPRTWESLAAASRTIQQKKIAKYGTAWAMTQAEGLVCDYTMLMGAYGGVFQDQTKKWIINADGAVAALQFMVDSIYRMKIADPASTTLDDRTNRELFAGGQIPFLLNWTSAYAQFTDSGSSEVVNDVRMVRAPGTKRANTGGAGTTGGSGFGVVASSPNKKRAWEFIREALVTDQAQRNWLKSANQIPVVKSLYNDPQLVQQYPQFKQMKSGLDHGISRPDSPWYGQMSLALQSELNAACTRNKSPQQALDDAAKSLNDIQAQHA